MCIEFGFQEILDSFRFIRIRILCRLLGSFIHSDVLPLRCSTVHYVFFLCLFSCLFALQLYTRHTDRSEEDAECVVPPKQNVCTFITKRNKNARYIYKLQCVYKTHFTTNGILLWTRVSFGEQLATNANYFYYYYYDYGWIGLQRSWLSVLLGSDPTEDIYVSCKF